MFYGIDAQYLLQSLNTELIARLRGHGEALDLLRQCLVSVIDDRRNSLGSAAQAGVIIRLREQLGGWVDPLGAVLRRWRADRVSRALIDGRIGHHRAAALMREIIN